jgi:hypothetical protein
MIEPILFRPNTEDQLENVLETMKKLNEVIEAVNGQHHSIQTLNSILKSVESRIKSSVPEAEPQEQEDPISGQFMRSKSPEADFAMAVSLYVLPENRDIILEAHRIALRRQFPPPDPSGSQEQEQFPRSVWDAIWELTSASATVALATKDQLTPEDRVLALLDRRDKAQLAVIAAAHREYAQPGYRELDSAYSQGYKDGQKAPSVAQPGKGV